MADITIAWDTANGRGDWVLNPPTVAQTPITVSSPQQFAVGDGIAAQFALVYSQSAISKVVAQIYRNDWQGNQLLYATPRTNGLGASEDYTTAAWAKTRSSITTPGTLNTLRGTPAEKLVEDTSATTTHFIQRTSAASYNTGDYVCVSGIFHISERSQIRLGVGAGGAFVATSIVADLVALTVVNFAGTPFASGIIPLAQGWYRVWVTIQATAVGVANAQAILAIGGITSYTGDGASGLFIDGVQTETVTAVSPGPTSYIACPTTTAVTVTDYTLTSSGALTLALSPAQGAVLSWTGSYMLNVFQQGGYLQTGDDIQTAILISIFSDRRAEPDDVIPDGDDPRGWWADDDVPIGSRMWLLRRAKQTGETLQRAYDYLSEALQWMVDDGVVARFDINVQWVRRSTLGASITAYSPTGTILSKGQYAWAWTGIN